MPTLELWVAHVGNPPMPAMERIADLIAKHNEIDEQQEEARRARMTTGGRRGAVGADVSPLEKNKLLVLFQIEQACRFVKKYVFARGDEKLGGALNAKQIKAVEELLGFVESEVRDAIGATDPASYQKEVIERFGKKVVEKEEKKDQELLKKDWLEYFRDPKKQKELKLSFRRGLAHKWTFDQGGTKGKLVLYDTKAFKDAHFSEFNASLYVMDWKGAIYVYGQQKEKELKHTTLLAGAGVLCAGTIRIEEGQVKWLTGRSGHYQPKVSQILSFLERLKQYQVDLKGVLVFRENFTATFNNAKGYPQKQYEPCSALKLLEERAWPGAREHADSMRVD